MMVYHPQWKRNGWTQTTDLYQFTIKERTKKEVDPPRNIRRNIGGGDGVSPEKTKT